MPMITYVHQDGTKKVVDVPVGEDLMRAAHANGIDGIIGECGGALSCATCHVFVREDYVDRLPAVSADEDQMLDFTVEDRRSNSRLSCQLVATPDLDGMELVIAEQ